MPTARPLRDHCETVTESYPVQVSRSGIPFRYPVQVSRSGIPFRHPVQVSRSGIPFRYPVQVSRSGILFRYPVQISCSGILLRYPVQVPHSGILPQALSMSIPRREKPVSLRLQDEGDILHLVRLLCHGSAYFE